MKRSMKAEMREKRWKECEDRRREIYYRQQKVEGGRSYGGKNEMTSCAREKGEKGA